MTFSYLEFLLPPLTPKNYSQPWVLYVWFAGHVNCLWSYYFFFQLGYVIYRRVLRYYSGEEDGLGEYLQYDCKSFFPLSVSHLTRLYFNLFRYEESVITRCGKEIYHPFKTASNSRWIGIWLGHLLFGQNGIWMLLHSGDKHLGMVVVLRQKWLGTNWCIK